MTNSPEIRDAVNMVLAFAAKLMKLELVFWKQLKLKDGTQVFALCFPVSKWKVDPETKKLTLR